MIHDDLTNLKIFKGENELNVYSQEIKRFLDNNHEQDKIGDKPITLNIDHINRQIPFELRMYENLTNNHQDTHSFIKQMVEDWCGKYRDVLYSFSNPSVMKPMPISKINHHHFDSMFLVRGVVEGYQNFIAIPIKWYFSCPSCGNQFSSIKNESASCGCGRKSIKSHTQDFESRMYFQLSEKTQTGEPASSVSCFYSVTKQDYEEHPFNRSLVGETIDLLGNVVVKSKRTPEGIEHTTFIQFRGFKKVMGRVVTPERAKEIIKIIKTEGMTAFEELAYGMSRHVYGHEHLRQADFCCAVGLQKPDCDFGEDINTALNLGKVGDASVGKTYSSKQFLKFFPKSCYMQGSSTTRVGLLGGVDRNKDMGFIIRSGQVSKSSDSFLILDEVDKMPEEQTKGMFTAMSEGKHSLVNITGTTEYSYNTSFCLIANPKHSKFDPKFPKYSQIDLDSAFLSRIDILMLVDKPYLTDGEIDDKKYKEYSKFRTKRKCYNSKFDDDFLHDYAHVVKQKPNPKFDDKIKIVMENYVSKIILAQDNAMKGNNAVLDIKHVDERFFNTIMKLSKIVARSLFAETVTEKHFNKAVSLLQETSLKPFMAMLKEDGLIGAFDSISIHQATKMPTSVKDVGKWIPLLIKQKSREKIQNNEEPLVAWEEILIAGTSVGIREDVIEESLEKLRRMGDVFEPRPNQFKVAGERPPKIEEEKVE